MTFSHGYRLNDHAENIESGQALHEYPGASSRSGRESGPLAI
jgi:hypothetical protein